MSKQIIKLLIVLTLFTSLVFDSTTTIKAKNNPFISTSAQGNNPNANAIAADPNVVTWELLGEDETNLVGPFDSVDIAFSLPSDWKLTEGASLTLSLGVAVSTGITSGSASSDTGQDQPSVNGIGAGSLAISLNENTLAILPLDEVGEVVRTIQIPLEALASANEDGFVTVRFDLSSGAACFSFDQVNVVIRTSSYFTFPHESVQPSTDLINFPRPLYQGSFIPDSALLVIPDQPSAEELQAALTVASALGKFSGGDLVLDMVSVSKLTNEQELATHLIFVGKAASLPVLGQLSLPLTIDKGQFQNSGGDPDDGIVELVISPWNIAKVILVISGNTDQGTIKASQAVSTGVLRSNESPNLAIVQEVQTVPVVSPQPTDQTLSDLGYRGRLFESRGVGNATYFFNVPPGWTVDSDARFELVFGHSALLDYDTSGIVVLINGKPVGSVRLDDATANISTNKALITIPVSAVVPGKNRLDVRVNLVQRDICAPQNMRGLFINIWPESTLHLPLGLALINPVTSLGLDSYPAPFVYYPLLENTAFVLMTNNLESWQAAAKIASFLGTIANGPVTALKVFYGDDLPEAERSKYNLLVIGQPSQMPALGELNKSLPIPFVEGTDILAEGNFQVTYRIPTDSPIGYMETMPSPWNTENIVFAVLGNTAQGLSWATSALINPELRSQLAGNFALITDQQIITTDTRLSPTINTAPTAVAEVAVVAPNEEVASSSPAGQQATWVFPMFILSIILIVLISIIAAVGRWSRHRTRGNMQRGDQRPANKGFFGSIKRWFERPKNR